MLPTPEIKSNLPGLLLSGSNVAMIKRNISFMGGFMIWNILVIIGLSITVNSFVSFDSELEVAFLEASGKTDLNTHPTMIICRIYSDYCDIVCIDNNCSQEINAAINNQHKKGGGTVYLTDGVYPIDFPGILPMTNITLKGESWNTVLNGLIGQRDSHLVHLNGTEEKYLENIEISNIRLDGRLMKYEKAIMANYVRNLVIDHIWVSSSSRTCIGPDWIEKFMIVNNLVENCNFSELDGNGIGIGGSSSEGLISNNIVRNVTGNKDGEYGVGILLERLGGGSFHKNVMITNNIVSSSKDGFGLWGAEDIIVNSNIGYSNAETGITSGVVGIRDITVTNNRFENNTHGIYISNKLAERILISGNTLAGNSLNGIVFRGSNSTVSENTMHGNGGSGIFLVDFRSLIPSFNRFQDNQIFDNESGIKGDNVTNSLFLDNMIYNNDIAISFNRDSEGLVERNFCNLNADEPDKEQRYGVSAWEC
jgi:parallel beta-helix repeat protein